MNYKNLKFLLLLTNYNGSENKKLIIGAGVFTFTIIACGIIYKLINREKGNIDNISNEEFLRRKENLKKNLQDMQYVYAKYRENIFNIYIKLQNSPNLQNPNIVENFFSSLNNFGELVKLYTKILSFKNIDGLKKDEDLIKKIQPHL